MIKQYTFHLPYGWPIVIENRARNSGRTISGLLQEAFDEFIEKYNPQNQEKVNQWTPPLHSGREIMPLRSIFMDEGLYFKLGEIATARSQTLNREVTIGAAVRSAIAYYFYFSYK